MNAKLRFRLIILLVCASVLLVSTPAHAQFTIGPSRGEVTAVVIGIIAVGAALGVGIYFLARRAPSLTGCAASTTAGLQLQNEADQQTYALIGDTAAIKSGDRVRISGKKRKKDAANQRQFLVEKLSRDFGACKTLPATP